MRLVLFEFGGNNIIVVVGGQIAWYLEFLEYNSEGKCLPDYVVDHSKRDFIMYSRCSCVHT